MPDKHLSYLPGLVSAAQSILNFYGVDCLDWSKNAVWIGFDVYYMELTRLVLPGKSGCCQEKVCAACYHYYCCSQTVNDEKQIHATVDSKAVVITETSIRSSLLLNDADGTACLTNEAIFQNLALMGNLDTSKKKFLMYPRFLMVFLNNQIELGEPFNDVYVTLAHTQKVFSNMSRKGVKFSGKVTPLFDSMLVPHQAPEGEGSEQPTPFPSQSSTGNQPPVTASSTSHDTTQDSRDSLEGTNGSEWDQVQPSHDNPLSGDRTSEKVEGGLNLEELFSLCTNLSNRVLALETSKDAQATKILKLKDQIRKLKGSWITWKIEGCCLKKGANTTGSGDKSGSTKELVSTAVPKTVSTARPELSTARPDVNGIERRKAKEKGLSYCKRCRNIAQTVTVELASRGRMGKDRREEKHSKAAIQASTGKKRAEYTIEERAKFLAETIAAQRKFRATQRSAEIRSRPPTKSQLRNLMMMYLKNMGGYKHSQLKTKRFRVHRKGSRHIQNKMKATKKSKRQKIDVDLEEEEQLKAFLKIVPDEKA
ncbi:hypothetical protein Tco_0352915 [Tanacetum coccineum]